MKITKSLVWSLVLLVLVAALYRVIPGRPYGFAPQIAMAIFGGALLKDRKWAFALPLFSMFVSDLLYQALYSAGVTPIAGFYEGQWLNYLLFASVTVIGFFLRKLSIKNIALFSLGGATWYFLASNFTVWLGGGGLAFPKTLGGLFQTYEVALPFYGWSLAATLLFSAFLFGGYFLLNGKSKESFQVYTN